MRKENGTYKKMKFFFVSSYNKLVMIVERIEAGKDCLWQQSWAC